MKLRIALIIFYLLLPALRSFSQNLENILTDEVCTCLQGSGYTKTDTQQSLMAMGICMMESNQIHAQEIKKAWNIDANTEKGMEALGEKLSISLMMNCPSFRDIMTHIMEDENSPLIDILQKKAAMDAEHPISTLEGAESYSGIVKDFTPLPLAQLEVADQSGSIRFHFIHYFSGEDLIGNSEDLIGKKVEITFRESEFYNPDKKRFEVINEVNTIRIAP